MTRASKPQKKRNVRFMCRWRQIGASAALWAVLSVGYAVPASAQIGEIDLDTVRAGQFDFGKMWTFEYAPTDYFSETYGFEADPSWFEAARLSVLRIPGFSASFVSPHGLVATGGCRPAAST